jgi:hypothetical protein
MKEAQDIWQEDSSGGKKLTAERLQAYLEGRLSLAEQRDVEALLSEEGMESDAMDGLQQLSATEAAHTVNRLNSRLDATLKSRKRTKKGPKTDGITLTAIGIILLLALIAVVYIRFYMKK